MAKATLLEVLNKVQENLGEVKSSAGTLTSLSGINLLIFNTINEILYELASDYRFQQLEIDVNITFSSGVSTYTATGSGSAAIMQWDKDSFIYDNSKKIQYMTPQNFDRNYTKQTSEGVPNVVTYWGGFFRPYPIPNASAASKTLKMRAWRVPTLYSTATSTGTSWIPEGFDLTLLANYVTFKVLHYTQNPEMDVYYRKVFGDGRIEGQLDKMKRLYGSPEVLDENLMVEPIGDVRINGIIQPEITG